MKNNWYVILVNPLNHLSSNPCSLTSTLNILSSEAQFLGCLR